MDKVFRDDGLELGTVSPADHYFRPCPRAYAGSGTWQAHSSTGHTKYFVRYDNAIKWLERKSKNIYPISRLAEFIR